MNGAFLYRKPEEGRVRPAPAPPRAAVPSSPPAVRHVVFPHPAPSARRPSTPGTARAPAPPARVEAETLLAPQEYLDGAVALFAEGRFGAARELLERHLEQNGEGLAVRLTLANLYGVLRQFDQARA